MEQPITIGLDIALCRCMTIPARYCTGVLGYIGMSATDAPMVSQPGSKPISVASGTPSTRNNILRIGWVLIVRGRDGGGRRDQHEFWSERA